jgi:predicted transcriptional regulator
MGNTDLFLDKYRQLESVVKERFGDSVGVSRLESVQEFRRYGAKLKYARELRNLLVHNPKINGQWAAEANDAVIEFVDKFTDILRDPPRIGDVAIPLDRVLYCGLGSYVRDTMKKMKDMAISKVPVLDGERVIGVFSYETVFNYILKNERLITEDALFSDIEDDIRFKETEKGLYPFVSVNEKRAAVEDIFDRANEKHIRIKLVFLTENGSQKENLLGIVTPWELIDSD